MTTAAIHLFYDNKSVNEYNDEALSRIEGRETEAIARDIGHAKAVERARSMDLKSKHGFLDVIRLKENGRYMVMVNVDTADGLVNGVVGTLRDWDDATNQKNEKAVERIWIQFDDPVVGTNARLSCPSSKVQEGWTPFVRRKTEIHTKLGQIVKFTRHQFPVIPAMALTYHRSQGQTYEKVAVHISSFASKKCSAVYVAISRVTSSRGLTLFTENDMKFAYPTPKPSPAITTEMNRLRNEKSLRSVYQKMPENPLLMSFNIRSLKKHLDDILNDEIMRTARFIFLCETGMKDMRSEPVKIPNYVEKARIAVTKNQHRGLLLLVRRDAFTDVVVNHAIQEDDYEYICVTYQQRGLMNFVYLSPKMGEQQKVKLFQEFCHEADHKKMYLTICGDFNTNSNAKNSLKILKKCGLRRLIYSPTSDNNNCIDNIFTDGIHLRGIVYESVCSDHRPIFGKRIEDENVATKDPYTTARIDIRKLPQLMSQFTIGTDRIPVGDKDTQPSPKNIDKTEPHREMNNKWGNMRRISREILNGIFEIIDSDSRNETNFWVPEMMRHSATLEDWINQIRGLPEMSLAEKLNPDLEEHMRAPYRKLPLCLRDKYKFVKTTGDGSCFYNAASIFLMGTEVLADPLRLMCLFTLAKHRNIIKYLSPMITYEAKKIALTHMRCNQLNLGDLCYADYTATWVMSEVLQKPCVTINYFDRADKVFHPEMLRLNYVFESATYEDLCNLISSHDMYSQSRYTGYCARDAYMENEPFITDHDERGRHYSTLLKIDEMARHLSFKRVYVQYALDRPIDPDLLASHQLPVV